MNTEFNNTLRYACDVTEADFSITNSEIEVGKEVTLSKSITERKVLLGIKFPQKWEYEKKPISNFIYIEIEKQSSGKWIIIGASNPLFKKATLVGITLYKATPIKTVLSNEIPTKGEIIEIVNELGSEWTEETVLDLGTKGNDGEFSYDANSKLLTTTMY